MRWKSESGRWLPAVKSQEKGAGKLVEKWPERIASITFGRIEREFSENRFADFEINPRIER